MSPFCTVRLCFSATPSCNPVRIIYIYIYIYIYICFAISVQLPEPINFGRQVISTGHGGVLHSSRCRSSLLLFFQCMSVRRVCNWGCVSCLNLCPLASPAPSVFNVSGCLCAPLPLKLRLPCALLWLDCLVLACTCLCYGYVMFDMIVMSMYMDMLWTTCPSMLWICCHV